MSNYRHRRTGLIATLQGIQPKKLYTVLYHEGSMSLPSDIIEDSCDWEKIEDKPSFLLHTIDGLTVTNPHVFLYVAYMALKGVWDSIDLHASDVNRWAEATCGLGNIRVYGTPTRRDDFVKKYNTPKVLLTTEDGVHITDREKYLPSVQTADWKERSMAAHQYLGVLSDYKIFSSEAKRDEYILYNKPLLSVGEINRVVVKIFEDGRFSGKNNSMIHRRINELISLAKSKL